MRGRIALNDIPGAAFLAGWIVLCSGDGFREGADAGGLPKYYRENVIGGPGAFVLQIVNFDTFAEAMTNKLLAEISDASPHSFHATVP